MLRDWQSGGKPDPVVEDIWKPNVTVAAVVEQNGKFLLVREKANNRLVLNQPAGHLEQGESLIDAVVRETLEETQYPFTPTGLLGIYRTIPDESPDITYLRFCFCGKISENLNGDLDPDIIEVNWLSLEEIRSSLSEHRSPLVIQCIEDYLSKPPCSIDVISQLYA